MTDTTTQDLDLEIGGLAERLFMAGIGAFELATIHLGRTLGLYDALQAEGAATAAELADRAQIHPRYAREWLEQQAVAGLLDVDAPASDAEARRYALPRASAEVLNTPDSLAFVAPIAGFMTAVGRTMPALAQAYRAGTGLHFGDFGDDVREAQAAFNRPAFLTLLGQDWLPNGAPDVHQRLQAGPATVLDVACGYGWSSIALAQAYPLVRVVGIDLDGPSIERARRAAEEAGVGDRVTFEVADATDLQRHGAVDLVVVFEALHDLPHPTEVLRAIRTAADGAPVLVMDERAGEAFTAPGDELERFLYAASVLHCLPVGMSEQPSAATGTVMRPDTLRRYAEQAGFAAVEVLPIEHDFFRFYRLHA
jgi:2-polyprenyl-3-methyl-5-hydroxy-6-metoxy-1,4-benzoquinol methylase